MTVATQSFPWDWWIDSIRPRLTRTAWGDDMTYNFDPDRWYENERSAIDQRFRSGDITARQYEDAIENLDARYDEMLDRLDGTYQIPGKRTDTP